MIACCGLDCSKCEGFAATQADDDNKRKEVAAQWSARYNADIRQEHINCDGCLSEGRKFFHCSVCEIRQCCMNKQIANCAACDMYPCGTLKPFFELAPEIHKALDRLRAEYVNA